MLKLYGTRILCCLLLFPPAVLWAQSEGITHRQADKPLSEFIAAVESQTGYTFMHDNSVNRNVRVTVDAEAESLKNVLDRILPPLGLTYTTRGNQILIRPAAPAQTGTGQTVTRVSGRVLDEEGQPVIGAAIVNPLTNTGVVTDRDGNYTIDITPGTTILRFSYLGYRTQDVEIGGRDQIMVELQEDVSTLNEIVVVGYGTQKRRDIVGAIEQISGDVLEDRGNPNIVRSLQGAVPGLNVNLWDGKPTRASVPTIRGTKNSIGAGGDALVLIDGVEGALDAVNPSDVETISILKDASSAAVYGARGAFGVILVTTKNAKKDGVTVNYNGNFSVKRRTAIPQLVTNGLEWTEMYLESWQTYNNTSSYPTSIDVAFPFSPSWYEELKRRDADPTLEKVVLGDDGLWKYYGNTNWYDIYYRDQNYSTEHSVSVSGGSEISSFYISGRFFNQDGIYRAGDENYRKYNIRAKGDTKITKWLTLENNFDIARDKSHQPMIMYSQYIVPRQISRQGYPMTVEKNPDGTWTDNAVYVGWAGFAEGTSWQEDNNYNMKNTTALVITPIKDVFTIRADFSYLYNHSERTRLTSQYTGYTGPNTTITRSTYSDLENWGYNTDYLASNIVGTVTPDIGTNNNLTVMAGWNIEDKTYKTQKTYRRGVLYPDRPSFTLMDGDYYSTTSGGYSWGYVGFFGRVNYNYKGKYLVEASGRYDGTSKFPTNEQWGFFPSASVGWRLSEEKFLTPARKWLDNLKVRASIGTLGNGLVDPYKYLSLMEIKKSAYLFEGTQASYTEVPALVPDNLTWEKATTYDIGLDMDFFSNRLSFAGDYYWKYTRDMYTVGPTLPAVLGSAAPKGNYANMKTKGWELSLSWRDSFKLGNSVFSYNMRFMLWDSQSWITKYYNQTGSLGGYYDENETFYKGKKLGDIWGFQVEGLFVDQYDIDRHADQSMFSISNSGGQLMPGDLKFKDLNGDGIIDRGAQTLDDHGDYSIIGNSSPRYQYGINLGANWYGIGVSVFMQGIGKRQWYPAKESALFWGQYGRSYETALAVHRNRWTEANPDPNAYWPRYRGYQAQLGAGPMSIPNDRYLQNARYMRIKNITVDYSLPRKWVDALGLSTIKVYFSGENLFTFSPLYKVTKNFDPEVINSGDEDWRHAHGSDMAGDGYGYPMLKSITFGLNITF